MFCVILSLKQVSTILGISLKLFESVEAWNEMVSGFIESVQGHIIANKFAFLTKVRYSQRLNDPLISCFEEKESCCRSAHCLGCKVGLAAS